MSSEQLQRIFSSNRTEELGYDVWERFVISPTFPRLDIGHTQKPRVIVGGRGCGKTMLLRFLSHESAFSSKRSSTQSPVLNHIGLYWRADTQFANLLERRGLEEDTWRAAFGHLAAIILGAEVLRSLRSVKEFSCDLLDESGLEGLDFRRLRAFSDALPVTYGGLLDFFEDSLAEFETWANDVRRVEQPRFLPDSKFLLRLIDLIKGQLKQFEDAVFFVYIDEYENLNLAQQRMVNTWLKHSEPPLIFNLAMKRNGFKTRETEGDEALSDIHDFRDIDLEDFDQEKEFTVFAAEIFLSRLHLAGEQIDAIDTEMLRDPGSAPARSDPEYKRGIVNSVRMVLPSPSNALLARDVFTDPVLRERLKSRIEAALESRGASKDLASGFLSVDEAPALVVLPALLYRKRLSLTVISEELSKLAQGETSRFKDWIHNNFVGCYLQLFDGLTRPCPFYSGFETFCYLSRGNLRHFLELCHQALNRSKDINDVTPDMQAEAARQVAADFLAEVRSFGNRGNNLHTFVLRLGSLFSLSQQRPSQSEPERTHFSIQEGESELGSEVRDFLSEAVKWSVLFEEKGTKKKNETDPEGLEYVLNPIYAPYFHISYRKKRKIELSADEITSLISGNYDQVTNLLKEYQKKWDVDLEGASLPLFAHLDESDLQ